MTAQGHQTDLGGGSWVPLKGSIGCRVLGGFL